MLDLFVAISWQRPVWGWIVLPALLLVLWQWLHQRRYQRWQRQFDPLLLAALSRKAGPGSGNAITLLALFTLTLWGLVLAGPRWVAESARHQSAPALVISLDLSSARTAAQLTLAKLRLTELLEGQRGNRVSLQVFAGSAHQVLPLSEDIDSLIWFLQQLSPELKPRRGWQPSQAIALAERQLQALPAGQQLLVTGYHPDWTMQLRDTPDSLSDIWLLGESPQGELSQDLAAKAKISGLSSATEAPQLSPRPLALASENSGIESAALLDLGYWLLWPLAGLALIWWRRGLVLRW